MSITDLSVGCDVFEDLKDPPRLYIPKGADDNQDVLVSIVIPALNESITIKEFIDWCWEGLAKADVKGEIIIVDSSNDETPKFALNKGARVLRTPKKGLGQAYLDVIPYIRGKFVIMGDCDLTYDFRRLDLFVSGWKNGYEYVMGSRFKGTIERGAMPALHQYFGTPLTTWILNRLFKTNYSDIHCGMRGITKDALIRMDLQSRGWEYASEMVLKAAKLRFKTIEVPVTFYKDRDGRESHHKRAGFLSPWIAGWVNLKCMLIYSADYFLIKPGIVLILLGLVLMTISSIGGIAVGPIVTNLNSLLLGGILLLIGHSFCQTGLLSKEIQGQINDKSFYLKLHEYDYGMLLSGATLTIGLILEFKFVSSYIHSNYQLSSNAFISVWGLIMILVSIQTFSFTLISQLCRMNKIKK